MHAVEFRVSHAGVRHLPKKVELSTLKEQFFLHRCRLPHLNKALVFVSPKAASQVAEIQAGANFPNPQEFFPRPAKLAWRSPAPMEDSRNIPQIDRSLPNRALPLPIQTLCHPTFEHPRVTFTNFNRSILGRTEPLPKVRFLRGRLTGPMMCEHFRIAGTGESILEFSDLMSNILAGDDVQNFDTHRVVVLLPMRETSQGRHTGKLSGDSEQVKTTSALYNQETIHKNESTSYISLQEHGQWDLEPGDERSKLRCQKRQNC